MLRKGTIRKTTKLMASIFVFFLAFMMPLQISISAPASYNEGVKYSDFLRLAPDNLLKEIAVLNLRKAINLYNNNDTASLTRMFLPTYRDDRGMRFADVSLSLRTDQSLLSQIRMIITSIDNITVERGDKIRVSVVFGFKGTVTDRDTEAIVLFTGKNTMVFAFVPEFSKGTTKVAGLSFKLMSEAFADNASGLSDQERQAIKDDTRRAQQDALDAAFAGGFISTPSDDGSSAPAGAGQSITSQQTQTTQTTTSSSNDGTSSSQSDQQDEYGSSEFELGTKRFDNGLVSGMNIGIEYFNGDNSTGNRSTTLTDTTEGELRIVIDDATVPSLNATGLQTGVSVAISESSPGFTQGQLEHTFNMFLLPDGQSFSYDPIKGIIFGNFDTELSQPNQGNLTTTANQATQSFDAGSTSISIDQLSTANAPTGRNISGTTITLQPNNLIIFRNPLARFTVFIIFRSTNPAIADIKVINGT